MPQEVSSISTDVAASVGSCNLTVMEQFQYAGISATILVLVIILVRSLTSFVKAVRT